ncbi:hypothetical protein [Sphingopyxis sp. MSC1_008]|uniref:hypothetical protein n=1 Tax=Sphingopyxis sp. MSC1_008 TaxID=2909265 RepID=UPI0020BE67E0|nr:hypothetical protein [Sphingopyxis sp. MSC1_008]
MPVIVPLLLTVSAPSPTATLPVTLPWLSKLLSPLPRSMSPLIVPALLTVSPCSPPCTAGCPAPRDSTTLSSPRSSSAPSSTVTVPVPTNENSSKLIN